MEGTAAAPPREWLRAVGLMAATGLFSLVNIGILIAVPFGLLTLFGSSRRLLAVILTGIGAALVAGGDPTSGLWYLERGWAFLLGGCFLALSLRWPDGRFLPKGLGAILGSFLVVGLLFWVRPGDWAVVDWAVRSRIEDAVSLFLQMIRLNLGPEALPAGFEAQALETVALQSFIFPALLGLASLSALGLSWWLHKKVTRSPGESIGPLREFRFNDQLVWVLILGVVALLAFSGIPERIGTNAVVFLGALYVLRGAGVVLFLTGGLSLLGGVILLVGLLILGRFVVAGALVIGLGDTWLDLRARGAPPRPEA